MPPIVSIVIVNYNAGPLLARCLDSLAQQTLSDFEVIVIDNASQDGSLAAAGQAAQGHRQIRIVRNPDNRGFAPAQNQGLRLAQGRCLMPLNFDIHLMPDFLEQAVRALEERPQAGSVSGKILRMHPDGGWTQELDNAGLLLGRRRHPTHRGQGEMDRGQYQTQALVFGAIGAAILFRRETLEDIAFRGQYFDESYFTWYEDIDLEWRARLRGWECLYVPEAVAYHIGDPQHNQRSAFAVRTTIRNRWQMILSNDCLHCLARDARWVSLNEFELVRHVVKYHFVGAYLQALAQVAWRLPQILAKRRWVRSRAQQPCLPDYPLPLDAQELSENIVCG